MENKQEEKLIDDKVLPIPMLGRELKRVNGETFYIAEHEYGALFHVYNSMDLIIRNTQPVAVDGLLDVVRNKDLYETFSDEDRKNIETYLSMLGIVLTVPLFAFPATKDGLFRKIYDVMEDYLLDLDARISEANIQAENAKDNVEFERNSVQAEALLKSVKESQPK